MNTFMQIEQASVEAQNTMTYEAGYEDAMADAAIETLEKDFNKYYDALQMMSVGNLSDGAVEALSIALGAPVEAVSSLAAIEEDGILKKMKDAVVKFIKGIIEWIKGVFSKGDDKIISDLKDAPADAVKDATSNIPDTDKGKVTAQLVAEGEIDVTKEVVTEVSKDGKSATIKDSDGKVVKKAKIAPNYDLSPKLQAVAKVVDSIDSAKEIKKLGDDAKRIDKATTKGEVASIQKSSRETTLSVKNKKVLMTYGKKVKMKIGSKPNYRNKEDLLRANVDRSILVAWNRNSDPNDRVSKQEYLNAGGKISVKDLHNWFGNETFKMSEIEEALNGDKERIKEFLAGKKNK